MMVLASSSEFLFVPLDGPQDDLTDYPVYVALADPDAGEPETGDYREASWASPLEGQPEEVAWKPSGAWGDSYPPGEYMAYVRVVDDDTGEDVRLPSGRVRVGDSR